MVDGGYLVRFIFVNEMCVNNFFVWIVQKCGNVRKNFTIENYFFKKLENIGILIIQFNYMHLYGLFVF